MMVQVATLNDVFNVTVNPQNDPPIGVADQIILDESTTATTVTGGATSVLANDSDPESDPISVLHSHNHCIIMIQEILQLQQMVLFLIPMTVLKLQPIHFSIHYLME